MEELLKSICSNEYEEDGLVTEIFEGVSPFFVSTQDINKYNSGPLSVNNNNMVSGADFSVPAIEDFENIPSYSHQFHVNSEPLSRISILEKGLSKVENKYILKIKICGNGTTDDGYKWRKYGQKSIKNSLNPRSYYRCTNPRCNAKKQVERSNDDTDTLMVTYEGLHLHYADPFFTQEPDNNINQPTKKPKTKPPQAQVQNKPEAQNKAQAREPFDEGLFCRPIEGFGPQGLLEDMVPLVIRNPSSSHYFSSGSSSSSGSYPSPPTSPSSLSWSPNYSATLFDLGL